MKHRLALAGLAAATLVAGWWAFGRSAETSKPSGAAPAAVDRAVDRAVDHPVLATPEPTEPGHAVVYRNVHGVVEPIEITAPVIPQRVPNAPPLAPYWMHHDPSATTFQGRRLPPAARDAVETKRYEKQLALMAAGKLDKRDLVKPTKPEVVPGANRMRKHVQDRAAASASAP